MRFKKMFAVLAASLMLGGALTGCGGGEKKQAAADDNSLVIYCPHPLAFINPLVEEFEKQSGVKVEVIAAGTGELLSVSSPRRRIRSATSSGAAH